MKKLALFALTLALSLPLFAGARPAAAAQVTAVAQATGSKDPFALTWDDDTKGNTKTDDAASKKMHDLFAGLQYIITDQQTLILAQVSGSNLQQLLPPIAALDANGKGYYIVHLRAQNVFVDGTVYHFSDDPSKGLARLTLVLLDSQGNSASTYIEQDLAWAGSNPSPASNPSPNPFGL